MRELNVPGGDVRISIYGEGDSCLLIVPGLGRDGGHYGEIVTYLSSTKKVVIYDPRSHGENGSAYSFAGQREDVQSCVDFLKGNETSRLSAWGHSLGALTVAFGCEGLESLCLSSMPYRTRDVSGAKFADFFARYSHATMKIATDVLNVGYTLLVHPLVRAAGSDKVLRQDVLRSLFISAAPIRWNEFLIRDWPSDIRALLEAPSADELDSVPVPTTIVYGGKDRLLFGRRPKILDAEGLPPEYQVLGESFPQGKVEIIPDAGHAMGVEFTHGRNYEDWPEETQHLAKILEAL